MNTGCVMVKAPPMVWWVLKLMADLGIMATSLNTGSPVLGSTRGLPSGPVTTLGVYVPVAGSKVRVGSMALLFSRLICCELST